MINSNVRDDSISENSSLDKIRVQNRRYQYQALDFEILLDDNLQMPTRCVGG
jgi:hypothetical protein